MRFFFLGVCTRLSERMRERERDGEAWGLTYLFIERGKREKERRETKDCFPTFHTQ